MLLSYYYCFCPPLYHTFMCNIYGAGVVRIERRSDVHILLFFFTWKDIKKTMMQFPGTYRKIAFCVCVCFIYFSFFLWWILLNNVIEFIFQFGFRPVFVLLLLYLVPDHFGSGFVFRLNRIMFLNGLFVFVASNLGECANFE